MFILIIVFHYESNVMMWEISTTPKILSESTFSDNIIPIPLKAMHVTINNNVAYTERGRKPIYQQPEPAMRRIFILL